MAESKSYRFPLIKNPSSITSIVQLRPRHSRTSLVPGCSFAPTEARARLPAAMRSRSSSVLPFGRPIAAHCSSKANARRRKGSERFFGGGGPIVSRQSSSKSARSAACKSAKAVVIIWRFFVSDGVFILSPANRWWKPRNHQSLGRSDKPCRAHHLRGALFQSDVRLCQSKTGLRRAGRFHTIRP